MLDRIVTRVVRATMVRSLRKTYRRVVWHGPPPDLPEDRSVVLYANHHSFHDGYLLWLVCNMLNRRSITWMEEWDRYPLFAPVGARPFPADDAARRSATVRRTGADMQSDPATALIYFPEGRLHRPEEGILKFDTAPLGRLQPILGKPTWLPVAVHATWLGEEHPSIVMAAGSAHAEIDGAEYDRLSACWSGLKRVDIRKSSMLLDGRPGGNERWEFSRYRRYFSRYL